MRRDTLKRVREAKGLTQMELAGRAGVTNVYISLLETRKKRNPSLAVLRRLARALGVSAGELITLLEKQEDAR